MQAHNSMCEYVCIGFIDFMIMNLKKRQKKTETVSITQH